MRKTLIIVANSSLAKVYFAESTTKLVEIKSFAHNESHLKKHDLVTDKPGISTCRIGSTNAMEDRINPKTREKIIFADEIVKYLEESHKNGEFNRLYLIATPSFLGHLRHELSTHITQLIQLEIPKDLTAMHPEEIRTYLPVVL